jgi:ankyrin repeat protein
MARDEVDARRLILLGANVNALTPSMQTPLSWAMENRRTEIVEVLMQFGAKEDIGFGTKTALEYARKHRRTFIKHCSIHNPVSLTNQCLLVIAANFKKLHRDCISLVIDLFVFG